jgi:hypothetical protein
VQENIRSGGIFFCPKNGVSTRPGCRIQFYRSWVTQRDIRCFIPTERLSDADAEPAKLDSALKNPNFM